MHRQELWPWLPWYSLLKPVVTSSKPLNLTAEQLKGTYYWERKVYSKHDGKKHRIEYLVIFWYQEWEPSIIMERLMFSYHKWDGLSASSACRVNCNDLRRRVWSQAGKIFSGTLSGFLVRKLQQPIAFKVNFTARSGFKPSDTGSFLCAWSAEVLLEKWHLRVQECDGKIPGHYIAMSPSTKCERHVGLRTPLLYQISDMLL